MNLFPFSSRFRENLALPDICSHFFQETEATGSFPWFPPDTFLFAQFGVKISGVSANSISMLDKT